MESTNTPAIKAADLTDEVFLTVVYRVPRKHTAEFSADRCSSTYFSAASWSHALDDRDAARAALATPAIQAVAPDLASLTRWSASRRSLGAVERSADGAYFRVADVERLLSHPAQAPVEPVSALTDEQIVALFDDEFGGQDLDVADNEIVAFARALLAASPKVEPVSAP